jgi:hypothetical protein
MVPVPQDK